MKYITTIVLLFTFLFTGFNIADAATYSYDLKLGSTGTDVEVLQSYLESKGFLTMPVGAVKGYYGAKTMAAVSAFQKSVGLPSFGFFGPMTRKYLNEGNQNPSSLMITSPNGGEVWRSNSVQPITWNYTDKIAGNSNTNAKLDLYLVRDMPPCNDTLGVSASCAAPYKYLYVLDKNISYRKTYEWIVGTDIDNEEIPPANYKVRICLAGSTVNCDLSDSTFTIASENTPTSPIKVTSPNGGEKWDMNSVHRIAWTNSNKSSNAKVDLYLFNSDTCTRFSMMLPVYPACPQSYITLDKNIKSNATYNWIVGTDVVNNPIPAGDYLMKICTAGTYDCDVSDQNFTINPIKSALIYTLTTDKKVYSQDETINMTFQAYNSSDSVITLGFTSGCITKYTINSFDSMKGVMCTANAPQIKINAKTTKSWDMVHSPSQFIIPEGTHNLNAGFVGTTTVVSTQITITK